MFLTSLSSKDENMQVLNDPINFPTHPLMFSPIILLLVATLLILGFLVGLSCQNQPLSSEIEQENNNSSGYGLSSPSGSPSPSSSNSLSKKSDSENLVLHTNFLSKREFTISNKKPSNQQKIDTNINLTKKILVFPQIKTYSKRTKTNNSLKWNRKSQSLIL